MACFKLKKQIIIIFKLNRFLLIFLFVSNCSSPLRKMPIQMARTTQIDFYKQYYDFGPAKNIGKAQDIVASLMGSKETWAHFTKRYGRTNEQFLSDIEKKRFYVQGSIILTTYLSPKNHDMLFVDGTGRYSVIYQRASKNEILFTADYFIKNIPYSIKNDILTKGILQVKISQVLIRHFNIAGQPNINHLLEDIPLYFEIRLEKAGKNDQVFRIKYVGEDNQPFSHPVYFKGDKIGFMQFDNLPNNNDKLFDLRGRNFLRKDY
ncbi:MAG: hypothetical protein DWQ05_18080 [Calditrichaeota bacterium]|nr:MAG: hypothetical protein DWQ05_18080 [Calditrichota bacterium]